MRLATYNIAGRHTHPLTFAQRLPSIVEILRECDADVIGLTEVDGVSHNHSQAHEIAVALGMTHVIFVSAQPPPRYFGNAILSRFPLHPLEPLRLPRGSLQRDNGERMPGQLESRLALPVQIPELDVMLLCTHLGIYNTVDSEPDGEGAAAIRMLSNNDVVSSAGAIPVILMGDLNLSPVSPLYYILNESWTVVEGGTETTFPGVLDSGIRECPATMQKIDYICCLRKSHGKSMMPQATVVMSSHRDARSASDHFAVFTTLQRE